MNDYRFNPTNPPDDRAGDDLDGLLAAWHRENADVQALLPLLATYLGHARYSDTAYYVTATADLLGMAADRAFVGGRGVS